MKKKITYLLSALTLCCSANAVVVQKMYLKNGSVLSGYIQQQDNNDNIIFQSDYATICVPGSNAYIREKDYSLNELDKKWAEWAEKNNATKGFGDNQKLTLSEISFNHKDFFDPDDSVAYSTDMELGKGNFEAEFTKSHATVTRVKLLQKGVTLKYLELTPNLYQFQWSDVDYIEADPRPNTLLSGIDRAYQLDNGREIRGQYAGETEKTLSLYTEGGMAETFDIEKVAKYFFKPVNPNQTLFEQSELIDIIQTKSHNTFRGIIVERNFTAGNNYLRIEEESGSLQMVKFSDVVLYIREENKKYKPLTDILLKEGEVVINRVLTDSVNVTKKGNILILDSISPNVSVSKEVNNKIIVEYANPRHLSSDHLLLIKLNKLQVKKKTIYSFSTDIFEMKKYSPQSIETSVNNTTRLEYVIDGNGVFALYDLNTKKAMPFIAK